MKSRYLIASLALSGVLVSWAGDGPESLGKSPIGNGKSPIGLGKSPIGKQPQGDAQLSGTIFYDSNENLYFDSAEVGKGGAVVSLYQRDSLVATTTTDEGGNYMFHVPGGTEYTVVLDNGYRQNVFVGPGQSLTGWNHGILLDRAPSLNLDDGGGILEDRGLNILNPRLLNSANVLRDEQVGGASNPVTISAPVTSVTPFRP